MNKKVRSILLLSLTVILLLIGVVANATTPIEEIRTIIAQRSLYAPPSDLLSAINVRSLDNTLKAIDPYARYIPVSENKLPSLLSLGIEIFLYNSRWWVRPDPGGPSDQAGIPEISELQAINNNKVNGFDGIQISALLDRAIQRGNVILSISYRIRHKWKNYTVKPTAFRSPAITWSRSGAYVIMRIGSFVAHDTAPLLSAIYAILGQSRSQIIIDLRGCSGGDLFESIEIAGMFVHAGLPLISTYDRAGKVQSYQAQSGQKLPHPIYVLIDSRTASSAEILAGILQYHRIARLVGERSFGKCVSQTIIPLSNGSSLWLTSLSIRFPDNVSCTEKGVNPDIFYPDISIAKNDDIIKVLSIYH